MRAIAGGIVPFYTPVRANSVHFGNAVLVKNLEAHAGDMSPDGARKKLEAVAQYCEEIILSNLRSGYGLPKVETPYYLQALATLASPNRVSLGNHMDALGKLIDYTKSADEQAQTSQAGK